MLKKIIKHIKLVCRHKWEVFKLCYKAGIVWQGIIHDLSKFTPTEFLESVKYYNGSISPIIVCKEKNGYSKAWLHHKGRNKHHAEYWYDANSKEQTLVMPFRYACEMVCDQLAAGKAYEGKNWYREYELEYFRNHRETFQCNEKIKNYLEEIYIEVAKEGIDKVITKKNLRRIYDKHVNGKMKGL